MASVSDDRTLRLWSLPGLPEEQVESGGGLEEPSVERPGTVLEASLVVYAHAGRIWDVMFLNGLLVTCSEDCTIKLVFMLRCALVTRLRWIWKACWAPWVGCVCVRTHEAGWFRGKGFSEVCFIAKLKMGAWKGKTAQNSVAEARILYCSLAASRGTYTYPVGAPDSALQKDDGN